MITNITITNIRGFGQTNNSINVNLKTNKINILIAPNGSGKSSFALAFDSLNRNRLDVEAESLYQHDNANIPELSITLDGHIYKASNSNNDIYPVIEPYVINSRLKAKAITKNINNRFATSTGRLTIEDISICKIPPRNKTFYHYQNLKQRFGRNGKLLKNLKDILSNVNFLSDIINHFPELEKFNSKTRTKLVENIRNDINNENGTSDEIKTNIDNNIFAAIEKDENYIAVTSIPLIHEESALDNFLNFYQLLNIYKDSKAELSKALNRAEYEKIKQNLNQTLKMVDTSGLKLQANEKRNELVVNFPNATFFSNGERDLLSFICQLFCFKARMKKNKKYLLIVDEVFDYLDDANMIAAQYYLSHLLREKNLYIVLLTHLNPKYFRNFVFNKSILNIGHLKEHIPQSTPSMKAFISFREQLRKSDDEKNKKLYDLISGFFFHYNPNMVDDISDQIPVQKNLKKSWYQGTHLKKYILGELNKYLRATENSTVYDPYAVCLGIRYRIEKTVYEQLDDDLREKFINTHKTDKKLEFAKENGVIVSDADFFLSIIHNDSDHLSDVNTEKACVYKLTHTVLKHMIKQLFEYKDVPLTLDCIM